MLHYLVLTICDGAFRDTSGVRPTAGDIAEFLAMDAHTFFGVFDATSPLFRSDLLQMEQRHGGDPRHCHVHIDLALVKGLRGIALTHEERHTLSDSPLADLFPDARAGTRHAVPATAHTRVTAPTDPSAPSRPAPTASTRGRRRSGRGRLASMALPEETPYTHDLDYLQEHFAWFKARHTWKAIQAEHDDASSYDRHADNGAARLRQAQAQERVWRHRIARRLQHTHAHGTWLPRAEELAALRQLSPFEKHVLLLLAGLVLSSDFKRALHCKGEGVEVATLLSLFWETLEEQMAALRAFRPDAPLVRDALLDLDAAPFQDNILRSDVRLDGRMVDYLGGFEEDMAVIEGSHLYRPTVDLARVMLPADQKQLIVETVRNFPAFQRARQRYFDTLLEYGCGLVLLFWGPSGSGKTLMANALASSLGKRLLLVNYPRIGQMSSDQALKFLFREAKIHDAVLFFDECESIFESRERQNREISLILSEIERHDGLIIMATNRPAVLDEAMHRRITLAVEFQLPNAAQREHIWQAHLPSTLPRAGVLDLPALAQRYELSGGLIKNAVLAALALAAARNPDAPAVCAADLEQGARLQMRSQLRMAAFEAYTVPQCGLEALLVPGTLRQALDELLGVVKIRRTLITDWGFADAAASGLGVTALFHGQPGTGKRLAAEAIAYELGRPLRRVHAAHMPLPWIGETVQVLKAMFEEARHHDAVLVIEDAHTLVAGRHAAGSVTDHYTAVLLHEMDRFPGVVILIAPLPNDLDEYLRDRLQFTLAFPLPDRETRAALWRQHLPTRMPLASDVSCAALAALPLTGAQIRKAVLRAAARAAIRPEALRWVTHADLTAAAEEETRSSSLPKVVGFTGNQGG